MTATYKFIIETPWYNCTVEDEIEFEEDPTPAELDNELQNLIWENFYGSWEKIEHDD